jgi:hypothetical protein
MITGNVPSVPGFPRFPHFGLQVYLSGKSISAGISIDAADVLAGPVFLQTGGGSFTAASRFAVVIRTIVTSLL